MAMAAWDRKCSTKSASCGVNCPGVACGDFQQPEQAVTRNQRRAQHRVFTNLFVSERVGAVVIEHVGKPGRRLVFPCLPDAVTPVEAIDAAGHQHRRHRHIQDGSRSPIRRLRAFFQAICSATRRRARVAFVANEERGRVIVVSERSKAIEDLVEEVLGVDLLHDFPVDPVAHVADAIPVDLLNGVRQRRCGRAPGDVRSSRSKGRRLAHDRNSAPCASTPAHRADHQVRLDRRMLMPDEASQRVEVPGRLSREPQEQVRLRPACLQPGNAAAMSRQRNHAWRGAQFEATVAVRVPPEVGRPARRRT